MKKRLIVGITGATGAVYGVRMLEALKTAAGWESHVVLSDAGALNLWHELKMNRKDLEGLATTASAYPKSATASARNPRSRGKLLRARQTTAPPTMRDLPTASRT